MSSANYKYSLSHSLSNAYTAESIWDEDDADYIATDCAKNYFHERDGWESKWPIEMTIWTSGGKEIGRFSVELEHEPLFSATPVKSAGATKE